jgi:hypothetical protein
MSLCGDDHAIGVVANDVNIKGGVLYDSAVDPCRDDASGRIAELFVHHVHVARRNTAFAAHVDEATHRTWTNHDNLGAGKAMIAVQCENAGPRPMLQKMGMIAAFALLTWLSGCYISKSPNEDFLSKGGYFGIFS